MIWFTLDGSPVIPGCSESHGREATCGPKTEGIEVVLTCLGGTLPPWSFLGMPSQWL